ncbi:MULTISPECIES: YggT family protein [Aestuariimicrobium]|uniref:YggT family protein n=1 Tax=Aestuariimicrobium TaxID=396388 RepID=UPI0003B32151|nr:MULTISPECIES: YggT family protein [Aestuariimicrobium]CAI9399408.1 hypothetical protein AESSP_00186 [Aestuariimicrobium sp. T2.26MG-19.2B]
MQVVGVVLAWALQIYMFLFFVRMILSFIPALSPSFTPRGVILVVFEVVYTLTDPPIRFFERFLPPLRVGQVAFSLGFMAAWLSLLIAQRLVTAIFF